MTREVSPGTIVVLIMGFLLTAILTPIAMNEVVGTNTTGWQSSVKTIYSTLLPILYMIGVALYFIPKGKESK